MNIFVRYILSKIEYIYIYVIIYLWFGNIFLTLLNILPIFISFILSFLILIYQYIVEVFSVAFSPNVKYLATGSGDGKVNLIDIQSK
jgi:hypothetical protein